LIDFPKIFFFKILLLTVLTINTAALIYNTFAENSLEKIITSYSDETEAEDDLETDFYQKINQKAVLLPSYYQMKKSPFVKNTKSLKLISLEFKTPPPKDFF
jgi:hypothetical protein